MRYLLIILSLVVLSCNSEKRLYKKCVKYAPYCVKNDSATTIEHDTLYRDTTVYISQKADTVVLDNPCALLCDSLGQLREFSRTKNDNGIVTTISTKNNRLEVNCAVDSLQYIVDSMMVVNTRMKTKISNTVPVAMPPTFMQNLYKRWFYLSILILLILFAFRYLTGRL